METLLDNAQDFIKEGVCIIHFEAKWCAPCKQVNAELRGLEKDFAEVKFGRVDVDASSMASRKYVIVSVPTIIIFKEGEELERFVGNVSAELVRLELAMKLGKHIEGLQ